MSGSGSKAVTRFFGRALMWAGLLICILTGLCSTLGLVFIISMSLSANGSGAGSLLGAVLGFGGLPFVFGLGMHFLGRSVVRQAGEEP